MLLIALLSVVALLADGPVSEARELVAKKKWDDAYSVLAEHLKRDPGTAAAHGLYGEVLQKLDRRDESAHHLAIALALLEGAGQKDSKD